MRARTGKIARLPDPLREELNHRLKNGAHAKNLVVWLNQIPEVQAILTEFFAAKPIREQNISEWRAGGYQDWLRLQESRVRIRDLTEEYESFTPEQGRNLIDRHVDIVLALELAEELETLDKIKDRDIRWKRLHKISMELARLREARTRDKVIDLRDTKLNASSSGFLRPSPANSAPQNIFSK